MHCYICDKDDSLISFDKEHGEYSPCSTCQAIIEETLQEFEEVDTEGNFEMDYPICGQDDRPHGESVEPASYGI